MCQLSSAWLVGMSLIRRRNPLQDLAPGDSWMIAGQLIIFQLVRDLWQSSPGTSVDLPVQMKAIMQKVRATISWSEESGFRNEETPGVLDADGDSLECEHGAG